MPHISEVEISVIKPKGGLIGFASFVLNGSLYLSSVGIHSKLDGTGYRLTYPTQKAGKGQPAMFHPINRVTAKAIEQAVFAKLKDVMEKRNVGYDCVDAGQYAVSD